MPRGSWRGIVVAFGLLALARIAEAAPPRESFFYGSGPAEPTLPTIEQPVRDLTPPGFTTDAPTEHPAYHGTPGHLKPAAPEEGGPFASVEFLLLRPRRTAFDFVVPGDATGLVPSGPVRSLNFDVQPGVRVELGHRFGESGWEAYFGYTYFHSSAADSLSAPAGQTLFPTLTKPGLTNTVTYASAQANFEYNAYDLLLGKRFAVDEHFAVRLSGGLRFASLRQAFSAYYDGLDARSATVSANSNFQGIGPILGAEGVWVGWKGFHLYARANGGFLSGQSDNPLFETNNAGKTVYANTAYNIRKVVPMASASVGLGWQYRTVTARVGYEITNYWNVVDQPRFVDDVGVGKLVTRPSNVSLEGLFVQLGVAF